MSAQSARSQPGKQVLWQAFQPISGPFSLLLLFSLAVNLLMLTGPLYMMQVYDRVLTSGSVPTLLVISAIVGFLFLIYGILDSIRLQITTRLGGRMAERLDRKVFDASMQRLLRQQNDIGAHKAQQDVEAIRTLLASSFATAVLDLIFVPIFFLATFAFHPALGWAAVLGMAVLIALTLLGRKLTAPGLSRQFDHQAQADRIAEQMRGDSETILAMGMVDNARRRWAEQRRLALIHGLWTLDMTAALGGAGRAWRMALQSAILGIGAWAVLQGQMSAGAIIAASVLVGRALQPVESVIAHWPGLLRATEGWHRLVQLVDHADSGAVRTQLPRPKANLTLQSVSAGPRLNMRPLLRHINLELPPGTALGVIGPAGSGKSSLARVVTGVWPVSEGSVRLGGADLDQYDPVERGRLIGYLPQRVAFLDGTVAENIARFDPFAQDEAIIAAAQMADAHEMILSLPKGYDTSIMAAAPALSGGQMQRIGLARALFGGPVLLVLDEPNSALDAEGAHALNAAIRQQKLGGGCVIITSHRPAALLECELVLVLDQGNQTAFGPRDSVLKRQTTNPSNLQPMLRTS